jgi:hypothetical protein
MIERKPAAASLGSPRYKYSAVLVIVAAIVVVVAVVEAETSGVGVYVADVEQL